MSLKKIIVSGAAALALMGTVGSAANVQVAKDGTGDYLLAPAYYALGNWKTELKVVNTNTTRAVAAKVIVRDSRNCDELVDFVIYLTPGDVWTGTIYEDGGKIYVSSSDDSMILGGTPAPEAPGGKYIVGGKPKTVKVSGKDPVTLADKEVIKNVFWHGYVEVFGLVSYDPDDIILAYKKANPDYKGKFKTCSALDKKVFYDVVALKGDNGDELEIVPDYDNDKNTTTEVSNDDLMGKVTIYAESSSVNGRRYMSLNMLALENVAEETLESGVYAADTSLASVFPTKDKVADIDAALAKDHIYVMYEGDGNSIYPIRTHFTIPTKKYYFQNNPANPQLPTVYNYDNMIQGATGDVKYGFEYYYILNGKDKKSNENYAYFRGNKEECNYCNKKSTELSGQDAADCSIKIHEEVHFFEEKKRTSLYDSADPIAKYAFKEGGYIDFNLENMNYDGNMTNGADKHVKFKGMPIVSTTFNAKNVQGTTLNNWLYNQYRAPKTITRPNY